MMICKSQHRKKTIAAGNENSRGNALIYVLIGIALFAALSFVVARQNDTGEVGTVETERLKIQATGLTDYAAAAKSVIDQMLFTGSTRPDQLEFMRPGETDYMTAPYFYKIYHPQGGGLTHKTIPEELVTHVSDDPEPGWYLGRFNTVEWTPSSDQDIILTAYQISKPACALINKRITGSDTIPAFTAQLKPYLINEERHSGTNLDLTETICPGCGGALALCVQNNANDTYAFYSILLAE